MTVYSVFLSVFNHSGRAISEAVLRNKANAPTVTPCLSVRLSFTLAFCLCLSVCLSVWLAGCLSPMGKGFENHSFVADFSIFLSFVVFPASWNPFFRIPYEFLRGYSLSY